LTHAPTSMITDKDVAKFRDDGFVKLPRLLDPQDLTMLQTALCEALGSFDESPNSYDVTAVADSFWNEEPTPFSETSVQHDLHTLAQLVRMSGSSRLVDPVTKGPRG